MQSMTGFGRAEGIVSGTQFTFEIKSVNHRYLDFRFRMPSSLSSFETALTELLRQTFERGSFDISLRQKQIATGAGTLGGTRFLVDRLAAETLVEACRVLHGAHQTPLVPSLEVFAMTNRVFIPVEESLDTSTLWPEIKRFFEAALGELKKMREAEGNRLKGILQASVEELSRCTEELVTLAPEQPLKIRERLDQKLAQWKLQTPIDPQRLEWEVALLAEKADITEEIDRLRTHAKEFRTALDTKKSVGRKLDFLTQELHREANTIGSKAATIEVTKRSVLLKGLIEKLREQVQNVE